MCSVCSGKPRHTVVKKDPEVWGTRFQQGEAAGPKVSEAFPSVHVCVCVCVRDSFRAAVMDEGRVQERRKVARSCFGWREGSAPLSAAAAGGNALACESAVINSAQDEKCGVHENVAPPV